MLGWHLSKVTRNQNKIQGLKHLAKQLNTDRFMALGFEFPTFQSVAQYIISPVLKVCKHLITTPIIYGTPCLYGECDKSLLHLKFLQYYIQNLWRFHVQWLILDFSLLPSKDRHSKPSDMHITQVLHQMPFLMQHWATEPTMPFICNSTILK